MSLQAHRRYVKNKTGTSRRADHSVRCCVSTSSSRLKTTASTSRCADVAGTMRAVRSATVALPERTLADCLSTKYSRCSPRLPILSTKAGSSRSAQEQLAIVQRHRALTFVDPLFYRTREILAVQVQKNLCSSRWSPSRCWRRPRTRRSTESGASSRSEVGLRRTIGPTTSKLVWKRRTTALAAVFCLL
jgi:hypothetical protein